MEKEQFVQGMEANAEMLYRVAWTILRNEEDSRDAVQEAAMKAWKKRYFLRNEEAFCSWICRIVINCSYSILRKRKQTVPLDAVAEPAVPPPDLTLNLLIQSLPDKLRLPLMLSCAEGMTYREISLLLRLPLTTVTGRIRMAKETLRKELNEK